MNRPIEFRAWDIKGNEMYYFDLHTTDQGYLISSGKSIDDFPTMQFTGLLDKNGVKIFEGDIIQETFIGERIWEEYPSHPSGIVRIAPTGIVKYKSPSFNVERLRTGIVELSDGQECKFFMNHYDGMYQFVKEDCQVIGNIYQNPELLKDKS